MGVISLAANHAMFNSLYREELDKLQTSGETVVLF